MRASGFGFKDGAGITGGRLAGLSGDRLAVGGIAGLTALSTRFLAAGEVKEEGKSFFLQQTGNRMPESCALVRFYILLTVYFIGR